MSESSRATERRSIGARIVELLSSFRLAVVLMLLLFLLTWLGTLYQVKYGLHAAQTKYFDSLILLQRLGDVFVDPTREPMEIDKLAFPLPGGMAVMGLLLVNLLFGGFWRLIQSMRKGVRVLPRIGVLITHIGIVILLLEGFVRYVDGIEGSVRLFEGQTARTYSSFHDWEIVVQRQVADGRVAEFRIPDELFADAGPGARRTFTSEDLPFDVVVEQAARNAEPTRKMPGFEVPVPVVDGFYMRPRTLSAENEANIPAAYVTLRFKATGESQRGLLWGMDQAPWTVAAGDDHWGVRLRRETYQLPFAIRLEEFEAEFHPGTRKPKAFRSRVTVDDPDIGQEREVLVQMNEPLRKGNLVVYQSSWGPQDAGPNTPLFSGFQVVYNKADQWPLIGCIVIACGMLLTFGWTLVRFIGREAAATRT